MKTAEELLKKKFEGNFLDIEYIDLIVDAMEEYAQQQVKNHAPDVSVAVCDHVWRDMHRSGDVCCYKCDVSKY